MGGKGLVQIPLGASASELMAHRVAEPRGVPGIFPQMAFLRGVAVFGVKWLPCSGSGEGKETGTAASACPTRLRSRPQAPCGFLP